MKKITVALVVALMAGAATIAVAGASAQKLPKCSKSLCQAVGCSPTEYCVSGAHVKNCQDICNGK